MGNSPGRAVETHAQPPNAPDRQFEKLHKLTPRELRERYRELFGVELTSPCKQQLVRRINWKLQALAHGDLSERARCRIVEISQDPELRIQLPAVLVPIRRQGSAARIPRRRTMEYSALKEGVELQRQFRGRTVLVKVSASGFEYQGRCYGSLSAVARAATGTRWNGLVFFGIKKRNHSTQEPARAAS